METIKPVDLGEKKLRDGTIIKLIRQRVLQTQNDEFA